MKIHKQEATFQPITIVLESQEELDILLHLVGSVSGRGKPRQVTDAIYDGLKRFCYVSPEVDCNYYFKGNIQSVE